MRDKMAISAYIFEKSRKETHFLRLHMRAKEDFNRH